MKKFAENYFSVLAGICWPILMLAQDVFTSISITNIINRWEYHRVENLLWSNHSKLRESVNTLNSTTISYISNLIFKYRNISELTLFVGALNFRLKSLRGHRTSLRYIGKWPCFKFFSKTPQTWYNAILYSSLNHNTKTLLTS